MADIKPNTIPNKGVVAIFNYSNGLKHVALVIDIQEKGFVVKESNYHAGVIDTRFVSWNDPNLTGFFEPIQT